MVTCEVHSGRDVAGGGRLNDQRGNAGDQRVPNEDGLVPALVACAEHRPLELGFQFAELV